MPLYTSGLQLPQNCHHVPEPPSLNLQEGGAGLLHLQEGFPTGLSSPAFTAPTWATHLHLMQAASALRP